MHSYPSGDGRVSGSRVVRKMGNSHSKAQGTEGPNENDGQLYGLGSKTSCEWHGL